MTAEMYPLTEVVYQKYLAALINGERRDCHAILNDLLAAKMPVEAIYEDLFKRSLYQIGDLWQANQISVATQHLVTALTEFLLNQVYPYIFSQPRVGKRVVIACVPKELHAMGAKMVADLFEYYGWDSLFLGANVPLKSLLELIDEYKPDAIGLSLSMYPNIESLHKTLEQVTNTFSIPVIVGGQALSVERKKTLNLYKNTQYILSEQDLITSFLKK